jgi:hypothetical protein
MCEPK